MQTFEATMRQDVQDKPGVMDGRCFTLEDTVEFFNLSFKLKLNPQEKTDLVAFMRQL